MDLVLNSDQTMMRDAARKFVTTDLTFEARRKRVAEGGDRWADLAEMGWLMLPVPEDAGGIGGSLEDMALIAEELGRGIALEPFVTGAVLPARLLAVGGGALRQSLLAKLASGEQRFSAALFESKHRYSLQKLDTAAKSDGGGYVLTGRKIIVPGGADWLIVAARLSDDPRPALLLVDVKSAGVTQRDYRTIDGVSVADFVFENVRLPSDALLAKPEDAAAALDRALDETIVLICADAVGCMDRAIELTAEYLRIRKQFGQTLASFQALQHGVANLFMEANDARSMVYRAIAACNDDTADRARAVSACKIKVLNAARLVTGQSIHFHGGIGMTCEYQVGDHLRRILVAEQAFGNAQYHFERYLGESGV